MLLFNDTFIKPYNYKEAHVKIESLYALILANIVFFFSNTFYAKYLFYIGTDNIHYAPFPP